MAEHPITSDVLRPIHSLFAIDLKIDTNLSFFCFPKIHSWFVRTEIHSVALLRCRVLRFKLTPSPAPTMPDDRPVLSQFEKGGSLRSVGYSTVGLIDREFWRGLDETRTEYHREIEKIR